MLRDLFGTSDSKVKAGAPQRGAVAAGGAAAPKQCTETVLGSDTHFEGRLNCKGNVRMDGTFIGDIVTEGRITLGDQATVDGNLIGDGVTVGGIVRGDVVARKIAVLRTGRVWGDLVLEQLATEEGAFIQGVITMEEKLDIPAEIQYHREQKPVAEPEAVEEAAAPEASKLEARTLEAGPVKGSRSKR